MDKTAAQRAKRHRNKRILQGWQEVRVWVPTEADAAELRVLAAHRRTLFKA